MALYRKYRPARFSDVVGQDHVTKPLSTALDSGRINHAYLFSGPRGCGKTSSARIMARSLNCVEGPTSNPCGVCPSCVSLAPGGPGNLDVTELDAASHNGVEDMRELRDRAFYAPAESRYRVFIIDEAHMITNAGSNALLKIVEEPPEHLIFIFATTEPEKVIGTIRSRTHHYPFRLLTPPDMRGLLERTCAAEGVIVDPDVYPLVIRAGGGSPRDSLSIMDQLLAGAGPDGLTLDMAIPLLGVTDSSLIDAAVTALATGDAQQLYTTVGNVINAGHDPRRFAADLLDRLRDLMVIHTVPNAFDLGLVDAPTDYQPTLTEQAHSFAPGHLPHLASLVNEGLADMRGATAPRLLLEILCAKMLLPQTPHAGTTAGAAAQPTQPAVPPAPKPGAYERPSQKAAREKAEREQAERLAQQQAAQAAQAQPQQAPQQQAPQQAQQQPAAQQSAQPAQQHTPQQAQPAPQAQPQAHNPEQQQAPAQPAQQPAQPAPQTHAPAAPAQQPAPAQAQPQAPAQPAAQPAQPQPAPQQQAPAQQPQQPAPQQAPQQPQHAPATQSAPAAPVPQQQGGATPEEMAATIRTRWRDIRRVVSKRNSVAGVMLTEARVLGVRDNTLVLGHNTGALASRINADSNNSVIVQALKQELGFDLAVTCEVGTNPKKAGFAPAANPASTTAPTAPTTATPAEPAAPASPGAPTEAAADRQVEADAPGEEAPGVSPVAQPSAGQPSPGEPAAMGEESAPAPVVNEMAQVGGAEAQRPNQPAMTAEQAVPAPTNAQTVTDAPQADASAGASSVVDAPSAAVESSATDNSSAAVAGTTTTPAGDTVAVVADADATTDQPPAVEESLSQANAQLAQEAPAEAATLGEGSTYPRGAAAFAADEAHAVPGFAQSIHDAPVTIAEPSATIVDPETPLTEGAAAADTAAQTTTPTPAADNAAQEVAEAEAAQPAENAPAAHQSAEPAQTDEPAQADESVEGAHSDASAEAPEAAQPAQLASPATPPTQPAPQQAPEPATQQPAPTTNGWGEPAPLGGAHNDTTETSENPTTGWAAPRPLGGSGADPQPPAVANTPATPAAPTPAAGEQPRKKARWEEAAERGRAALRNQPTFSDGVPLPPEPGLPEVPDRYGDAPIDPEGQAPTPPEPAPEPHQPDGMARAQAALAATRLNQPEQPTQQPATWNQEEEEEEMRQAAAAEPGTRDHRDATTIALELLGEILDAKPL